MYTDSIHRAPFRVVYLYFSPLEIPHLLLELDINVRSSSISSSYDLILYETKQQNEIKKTPRREARIHTKSSGEGIFSP